jgi:hypothetical protein
MNVRERLAHLSSELPSFAAWGDDLSSKLRDANAHPENYSQQELISLIHEILNSYALFQSDIVMPMYEMMAQLSEATSLLLEGIDAATRAQSWPDVVESARRYGEAMGFRLGAGS